MNLITEIEAARVMNVSLSLLQKDRHDGRIGLPFLKIGKLVRYERDQLDAWLLAHIQTPIKALKRPPEQPKKKMGRPTKIEQITRRQKNLLT